MSTDTAASFPHIHQCACGTPVMEESVGHWQQQRIRELMAAANGGNAAADWHRYLHAEGILVPDEGEECGPWHHRVFLGRLSESDPA